LDLSGSMGCNFVNNLKEVCENNSKNVNVHHYKTKICLRSV
jgi:hypothetical protein